MILNQHGIAGLPSGGGSTVTIGGRKYPVIKIGNQEWLAENLDFKFSGCNIGGGGTPSTPNAWYYNNDEATYGIDGTRKCGLLYNNYAIQYLETNKSTLIPGWHVATNDEWNALATYAGGSSVAGTKLKSSSISWAQSWQGTDDYGLGVLPGGYRGSDGVFRAVKSQASLWTSTSNYSRYIQTADLGLEGSTLTVAMSVRLVKDAT